MMNDNKNILTQCFFNNIHKFVGITQQHFTLLTCDFCKTNVPQCCKSKWVGYSCFLYVIPAFFIPGSSFFSDILRLLYIVQGPIAHASDYIWHNETHISHGIDRWFATTLVMITIYLCSRYLSFFNTIYYGIIPLSSLYLAKIASTINDMNLYNISQTIWHITSPISCCLVYYNIYTSGHTL